MATVKKAKNPRFEVYQSPQVLVAGIVRSPQEWRWRLYAKNGLILASGEGFTREKDAHRAVEAVKRAVLSVTAYEVDR